MEAAGKRAKSVEFLNRIGREEFCMKYVRLLLFAFMIVCVAYAVGIYMIGSGTYSYLIWLVGAALFGLAFFLAGKGRWQKVPKALRIASCGLIGLALSIAVICTVAMVSHFGDEGDKDLDYIVVLGAQMRDDGPSYIYRYRLDAAYDYLLDNPGTICIVSGGKGANETVSEGDGGREYLISRGIAPERVIAETEAGNTLENIANSLEIMDRATGADSRIRLGIVTNNFHVFRGVRLAQKLTDHEVCGIAAYSVPVYLPGNMVRECFGILKDLPGML